MIDVSIDTFGQDMYKALLKYLKCLSKSEAMNKELSNFGEDQGEQIMISVGETVLMNGQNKDYILNTPMEERIKSAREINVDDKKYIGAYAIGMDDCTIL